MIKNIEHYVKKFKMLDNNICNNIVSELEKINWYEHNFFNNTTNEVYTRSGNQELEISNDEIPEKQIIMDKLWHHINFYVKENLKFSWFDGWQGFSPVRFNRYTETKKMAEHCDHISSLFDGGSGVPILSCLGLLNDNFEGGEFIMFENQKIEMVQGDLIIFPSNFLYPHRVEPVIKGTRYSYISWVW